MKIYIDESGAMTRNYQKRNQRYFVIAHVITKDCKKLHRCFQTAREKAINNEPRLIKQLKLKNEIKGSSITEQKKAEIYTELVEFCMKKATFEIVLSVVDNKKIPTVFLENKARSFNYFIASFISSKMSTFGSSFDISLLIDDRNVAPSGKTTLQDYLNTQFRISDNLFETEIKVSYYNSRYESLIQLADIVANTANRALNSNNNEAKQNLDLLKPILTINAL